MIKALKILGIIVGSLFFLSIVTFFILDTSQPEGEYTPKADTLATKMLTALNKPAWDTTQFIQWTFRGNRNYLWDKERHFVQLTWKKKKVLLNTRSLDASLAFKNGQKLKGKEKEEMIQSAWKSFCNDSYWLVAPFKVFDPGTKRAIVDSNKLLVQYTSGGVTPGDSYLWILDENYIPQSYKMWVSIIPIGGLKATWEGWHQSETGVMLPKSHKILLFSFSIENIHTATTLDALGIDEDPFVALINE